ncbi:heat shock factor binding protein 1-domain-containing protein, partial [Schizophyllum amplum]
MSSPAPTKPVKPALNGSKAEPKKGSGPDVSSPHELTAFVETLLSQLDDKFESMSGQILERMDQMSARVDALEASIQDIISDDLSPGSPPPVTQSMSGRKSGV